MARCMGSVSLLGVSIISFQRHATPFRGRSLHMEEHFQLLRVQETALDKRAYVTFALLTNSQLCT